MPGRKRIFAAALASAALVFFTGAMTARAQPSFSLDPAGDSAPDVPGAPRTPILIYRRLLEDGYELSAPLVRNGPVYFADVEDKGRRPLCLILDSFTGAILQTFVYTPGGLHALNRDAPGPGFPGYPPFPDARYASACYAGLPPALLSPKIRVVRPRPRHKFRPKRRVILRFRRHRLVRHKIKPACGPYHAPVKKRSPRVGFCKRPSR
ncbi:MAG TPA: hypothetical protein VMU56_01805 [Beijerinckiaceae bacterium]|nr:hypothetical protein [Beijerinckiaceae bacterium]